MESIINHLKGVKEVEQLLPTISDVAFKIIKCLKLGNTLFIAGNGGSASDAQHFSAELVGRFVKERKPLRAICLNTDISILTAISNDYNYNQVFKRQLQGLAKPGDLFLGITTSGKSENILTAIEWANNNAIDTMILSGNNNLAGAKSGVTLSLTDTARIQEMHILIIHIICQIIDDAY